MTIRELIDFLYANNVHSDLSIEDLAEEIDKMSVRRGHWELIDDIEPTAYSCSICNKVSACEWGYCPYCGAKMEEQE